MRRSRWKIAVPQRESHPADRHPQGVGGDLRHRGVRARAHVAGPTLHVGRTVGVHSCQYGTLAAHGVIGRRSHAYPDELTAVARDAWCRISPVTDECVGALLAT